MNGLFHNFPSSGGKFFYLIKWWLQQVFICAFIHTIIYLIVIKFVQCQWVKRSYMSWGSYKRSHHVLEEIPLTQIWNKLSFIFGYVTKNIRLKDSSYVEVWRMSELGGHMGLSWWPFFFYKGQLESPTNKTAQGHLKEIILGELLEVWLGGPKRDIFLTKKKNIFLSSMEKGSM